MVHEFAMALAMLLALGIEAAYVPSDDGGGDYLVRVEPDLLRGGRGDSPYQFTSDVPNDSRDVRRVKIYVADQWPRDVERSVMEAAQRPRKAATVAAATRPDGAAAATAGSNHLGGWLMGSLAALFLSLGANAYLGMLLGAMRQRYLRGIQQGYVKA